MFVNCNETKILPEYVKTPIGINVTGSCFNTSLLLDGHYNQKTYKVTLRKIQEKGKNET